MPLLKFILEFMIKNKIKRVFILGGLARKLQPLDAEVNKLFKDCIKKNSIQSLSIRKYKQCFN